MHRGLDHAGVDMPTKRPPPSAKPHDTLLIMALYGNQAHWRWDVVAGEWRHLNPPAPAPAPNAAPGGPPVTAPQQQPTDQIRAETVALEAGLGHITQRHGLCNGTTTGSGWCRDEYRRPTPPPPFPLQAANACVYDCVQEEHGESVRSKSQREKTCGTPPLSLGEMQRMADTQLHYTLPH